MKLPLRVPGSDGDGGRSIGEKDAPGRAAGAGALHRRGGHPMAMCDLRFRVDPGDVPPEKAARRLFLTVGQFEASKEALFSRGFPRPDGTTGMYDLDAIDRWRGLRHPHLFPELRGADAAGSRTPCQDMGDRFREAKERKRGV